MYHRILIPTDGSEASHRAVIAGINLAKAVGAQVVGMTVTPEYRTFTLEAAQLEVTKEQYAADSAAAAQRLLLGVSDAARDAGVRCVVLHAVGDSPYDAIIDCARAQQCDLINMASHGRRGMRGLLLGSETHKVLVHSNIPVLVHR